MRFNRMNRRVITGANFFEASGFSKWKLFLPSAIEVAQNPGRKKPGKPL
jgi:hypothetical protein